MADETARPATAEQFRASCSPLPHVSATVIGKTATLVNSGKRVAYPGRWLASWRSSGGSGPPTRPRSICITSIPATNRSGRKLPASEDEPYEPPYVYDRRLRSAQPTAAHDHSVARRVPVEIIATDPAGR